MSHTHKLILVRDPYENYTMHWCRECGLLFEKFESGTYELLPEWSKERLLKEGRTTEKFVIVPHETIRVNENRLGKSLKDIKTQPLNALSKILFGDKND